MNRNYERLSLAGKKCYTEMVRLIELYQTEWSFSQVTAADAFNVLRAVLKDHPEYFWLSTECETITRTCGAQVTVIVRPKIEGMISRVPDMRRQLDRCVEDLIKKAKRQSLFLYKQILFLHDYLVVNTDYVLNAPHCYDAYGCLMFHKAVCAGYTAAFQLLMQKLGVECGRVSGWSNSERTGEILHAWNYVKLSDGYYFIDVTWDDPLMNGGGAADNLSHDYFCVDINEMRLTHRFASDQFIPQSYGQKFDYYRYHGLYLDFYSFSAVKKLAVQQLKHNNRFSVKFKSKYALEEAKRDLFDGQKVFSIPGITQSVSCSTSRSGLVMCVGCR